MVHRTEQYGVKGNVEQCAVPDQAVEVHAHKHRMHPQKQQV